MERQRYAVGTGPGLEITVIALQGQFANMLGEKHRGISVEYQAEGRAVCYRFRQLIEGYPYELRALSEGLFTTDAERVRSLKI